MIPRSLAGVRAWSRRLPDLASLDPRTRENARVGGLLSGVAGLVGGVLTGVGRLVRRLV